MSMPGGMEWLIIAIAVLILFGGKKLPGFLKGLGKGVREFREAKDGVTEKLAETPVRD